MQYFLKLLFAYPTVHYVLNFHHSLLHRHNMIALYEMENINLHQAVAKNHLCAYTLSLKAL